MITTIEGKKRENGRGPAQTASRRTAERAVHASHTRRRTAHSAMTLLALCAALSAACRAERAPDRTTALESAAQTGLAESAIDVDGRQRRFAYYVPTHPTQRPPIVLALHGSGGSGARLRGFMGGALDRMAERRGFIAVYPEGFEGNWNGCRAPAPSSANRLGIDDVGFVRALMAWLTRELGADPTRVYAVGFSGGGHMAYRLALEIPDQIPAIAVIAASLPVEDELDCKPSGRPVSVMIVNGTADPVNPYHGGEVVAPTGTRLGQVRSTAASAEYFATIDGYPPAPNTTLTLAPRTGEGTGVDRATWSGVGGAEVTLVTIHGGGHTIPGPRSRLPDFVGATERRFAAVEEAARFLMRNGPAPQSELSSGT